MTYNIHMSDKELLSMNDETGDITLPVDLFEDPSLEKDSYVFITFEEDSLDIQHKYVITDICDNVVSLHWIQQLGESLLTEANPFTALRDKFKKGIGSRIDSAEKKTARADKKEQNRQAKMQAKILQNGEKLVARDRGPEGRTWKFYLQKEDGTYTKPLTQEEATDAYKVIKAEERLTPEVANAIVVTSDGFIIRRGLEDLYRKGIKLTKETAKLKPEYTISRETEELIDLSGDSADESEPSVTTPDTPSVASETTPSEPSAEDSAATDTTKPVSSSPYGVSKNTYKHFLKLLYVLRPKVYDAFDKPVDVSSTRELIDKVKQDNLADFEIEIDGKKVPALKWIQHAVKNKVLMERVLTEAPTITLDADDLYDPQEVDFKSKIQDAQKRELAEIEAQERAKTEAELKELTAPVVEKFLNSVTQHEFASDSLDILFEGLVPPMGKAPTKAGELVRAMMRILYRDYNDGDKFFEGYGLETCGSSAQYLFDNGFEEQIQHILDNCYMLAEDDNAYTNALDVVVEALVTHIYENRELIWTMNEDDSRNYSYEYIEEQQPLYEYDLPISDDVAMILENRLATSWDVNSYVEDALSWSNVNNDATVSRPWSTYSANVSVENLTRDGYEVLKDMFRPNSDAFWEEFVSQYKEELEDLYDDEYDYSEDETED